MAFWGYAQGLVVSALSLGGFAVGAFVGSRLGPLLLDEGSKSPYAPLFALMGALLIGGVVAVVLEEVGIRIRRRMALGPVAVLDGIGGALLIGALGLGLAWIAGAVALQTPGARELRDGHPAFGDPHATERRAAAVGPDPQRAVASRPVPDHSRAGGGRPAADTRHRRRRRRDGAPGRAWLASPAPPADWPSRAQAGLPPAAWW